MKETLRTGVVGCGAVGHFHAKAYQELCASEFVGVYDKHYEAAKAFAAQYGVKAFRSIEQMKAETGVEVLSICTPHPAHAEAAVAAANLGIHLLIEKPLADSIKACDTILNAAHANHVLTSTVCQRRFFPPCLRVKRAIDSGKIGNPVLGTVTMLGWRDKKYYDSAAWRGTWDGEGGGVLINQAPHQLDLLLWYMGEVEEVYGQWRNFNHPYIEVEDTSVAIIKFKNGALGNIVVTNSANPAQYGNVHVLGSNGACIGVQTDGGAMFIAGQSSITEPPKNDVWTIAGESSSLANWEAEDLAFFRSIDATTYYHKVQIDDFLSSILQGRQPMIDGLAGRRTVELFTAIYRSTRDNRPIKFPLSADEDSNDYDGRKR